MAPHNAIAIVTGGLGGSGNSAFQYGRWAHSQSKGHREIPYAPRAPPAVNTAREELVQAQGQLLCMMGPSRMSSKIFEAMKKSREAAMKASAARKEPVELPATIQRIIVKHVRTKGSGLTAKELDALENFKKSSPAHRRLCAMTMARINREIQH